MNPIAWHGIVLEVCNRHGITVFDLAMSTRGKRFTLIRGEIIDRMRLAGMSYTDIAIALDRKHHSNLHNTHHRYLKSQNE